LLRFPAPGVGGLAIKRLLDHGVLLRGDIRASRTADVEDRFDSGNRFRMRQILYKKASKVCGERNTEISGALAGATQKFGFEGDLASRHHYGTIMAR